jgi:N-acetylglucosaminyldiphosphoundecaprenol N-acetyl-beta-D-mannosaminyltransferase
MRYVDVPYVKFKGVKVSNICYQNVLDTVSRVIKNRQRGYICLTDVSNLILATKTEEMRQAINDSLLSLADGTPLVWFAWMSGCKEIERISGVALLQKLFADMDGCRHYLLGDTEQTIAKVIDQARKLNGNIQISGYSPPFKKFEDQDNRHMLEKIREAKPDVIWVCFGGGKQEVWMNQNFPEIDHGVMIGVGAAFKYFIGDIITPPAIFQKIGMQWLFRLTESFLKNPVNCIKAVRRRNLLGSKLDYVLSLPKELKAARGQIRLNKH